MKLYLYEFARLLAAVTAVAAIWFALYVVYALHNIPEPVEVCVRGYDKEIRYVYTCRQQRP